ncbi:hypothetical protein I302_109215 [Kwoniella bestiolae CBS 10118]|uniref:Uncharacterized protein n=1 Tax=Kwoniella bestiolae CBS 10118 TaxID=1296100 RepID=A0A1B9FVA9_9TREE|nr:hypothetical protein I302_08361 [Kwoniella bestiolae CBS 10118]OCF22710.1 hypothetical protein I302_08361 [Kwoniella bestiolae CBS 10118]
MRNVSLFLMLSSLTGLASAFTRNPTETRQQARSVPSAGGYQCFFSCPTRAEGEFNYLYGDTDQYAPDGATHYNACNYDDGENGFTTCYYTDDGQLYSDESQGYTNDATCAAMAETGPCAQENPDTNTYFRKRAMPRRMTPAEKRLAARQYKPKFKKSKSVAASA